MRFPAHLANIRVDSTELGRLAGLLNSAGIRTSDGRPFRADAGETAFIGRQLEYMRKRTYDVVYAESKALKFLPMANDIPDGARTFNAQQWDMTGMAKIISNFADDLPRVSLLAAERPMPVKTVGNAYDYSIEDVKASQFSGVPLPAKKADAARIVHERTLDEIFAFGNAEAGLEGMLNNTNVPLVSITNGDWDNPATTSDQILSDLYEFEYAVFNTSKELFPPDTLLLATNCFKILATRHYSSTIPETILSVFKRNASFIKTIDQWSKLDLADAQGDGPRMMAYKKDPMVIEAVMPRPFTQEPPQARNLSFVTNCHSTVGGVIVNYPIGTAYADTMLDT
jgi:hypothetical protein